MGSNRVNRVKRRKVLKFDDFWRRPGNLSKFGTARAVPVSQMPTALDET